MSIFIVYMCPAKSEKSISESGTIKKKKENKVSQPYRNIRVIQKGEREVHIN